MFKFYNQRWTLLLFALLCTTQLKGITTAHDYSQRVSVFHPILLAGFNQQTDGFKAGDGLKLSLTNAAEFGCIPHEGEKVLHIHSTARAANCWRTIYKDFPQKLCLQETPLLEFAILTQEAPSMQQYVRLSLFSGHKRFDAVAQILPTLWRTVIFDLSSCKFLNAVTRMEIGTMADTTAIWSKGSDFLIDGICIGRPLDLQFMLPHASDRFTAQNGSVSQARDCLRFHFTHGSSLTTTALKGSRNNLFSPPLMERNTIRLIMANQSGVKNVRLSFITDKDSIFDHNKSKTFQVLPHSELHQYEINFSDNAYTAGHLAGLRLEPEDDGEGTWMIDCITFERNTPIIPYAGTISSCTADATNLHIQGTINAEDLQKYHHLAIYEAPMHQSDTTLKGHRLLYEGEATSSFSLDHITLAKKIKPETSEDSLLAAYILRTEQGETAPAAKFTTHGMTHLATRFLAVVKNDEQDFKAVAPCFYVENWRDFIVNLYDFSLPATTFDVTKYGARGDGFTNDTKAFQRAIDACNAAGGGQVVIPGTTNGSERLYVLTSITLKNNVELHFEHGAVIWQSGDLRDYDYCPTYGHDIVVPRTPWTHCLYINQPLIKGNFISHVKITGPGTIRMNDAYTVNPDWTHYARTCSDRIHILPIGINSSNHITITDIDILRSNNYHTNFHGDSKVFFGNVKLHEVACVSGDGFSFGQGTRQVRIERCFFDSNDDGIVLTTSYKDPRSNISPWRPDFDDADHSLSDLTVEHSYINSATGGGGKAIALIPWGSTNPQQEKQLLDSICVSDCVLAGGYSVGTWPDNPFDGKPFTNEEDDDYSPVQNFRIYQNEYLDNCDLLCIRPTNFITDCGIRSSNTFQNAEFKDSYAYWTRIGNADATHGYGWAKQNGLLAQGLYLSRGIYLLTAEVKGEGSVEVSGTLSGKLLASEKFESKDWVTVSLTVNIPADMDCMAGLRGGNAQIKLCTIQKKESN